MYESHTWKKPVVKTGKTNGIQINMAIKTDTKGVA